jgi:hypothetical protein
VECLIDALRLSRASGVAIENLAGMTLRSGPPPFEHRARSAGGGTPRPILRIASAPRDSVPNQNGRLALAAVLDALHRQLFAAAWHAAQGRPIRVRGDGASLDRCP